MFFKLFSYLCGFTQGDERSQQMQNHFQPATGRAKVEPRHSHLIVRTVHATRGGRGRATEVCERKRRADTAPGDFNKRNPSLYYIWSRQRRRARTSSEVLWCQQGGLGATAKRHCLSGRGQSCACTPSPHPGRAKEREREHRTPTHTHTHTHTTLGRPVGSRTHSSLFSLAFLVHSLPQTHTLLAA
jgi:hypothetical protein